MTSLYDEFPIRREFLDSVTDKWISEGNDHTLLMNHNLNEDSVVFELGGYRGNWCRTISEKYNCNIFVYEPTKRNYEILESVFSHTDKVKIFEYGLSNRNEQCKIYTKNDTSSVYDKIGYDPDTSDVENIQLRDISEVLDEHGIDNVDLLDMNIEGSEYDVMKRLIESGHIGRVDKFQIQFHSEIGTEAFFRRLEIQKKLAETHRMIYNYDFCWESWQRKK